MIKEKEDVATCDCLEVHPEVIKRKKAGMPDETSVHDLADFFKIFGDSTRMKILFALDGEPMCVCDLAELLGMSSSAVSHQLKIMKQSALISYRRSGKNVYYTLADDHVHDIIVRALEHINEN